MKYAITMNDFTVREMTILDPNTTVEQEIAKWVDAENAVSFEVIE